MSCAELNEKIFHNVCSGENRSWTIFVNASRPIIRRAAASVFARYLGGAAAEDVSDAVQETYLRLVKNGFRLLKSYDPERSNPRTWLGMIARSVAVDALRRRSREVQLSPEAPEPCAEDRTAPEPQFPRRELSKRQNQVMHMLFDQDLDVAEAAALLGVKSQTVRSIRHQSLGRLRTAYFAA